MVRLYRPRMEESPATVGLGGTGLSYESQHDKVSIAVAATSTAIFFYI